jgi:DNA-binding transcriptional regulator LsrR (DeoR family)
MATPPGPQRQLNIAHVATRYYLDGKTRVEIAQETGLSRFKVARLLEEAIESGIVQINIASPSGVRLDLSLELSARFGLTHVVVVDLPSETDDTMRHRLGEAAADLLEEIVTEADVIGLTSGRTLNEMARAVTRLPPCKIVQLAGVAGPIQETGLEIMRRMSGVAGVRPWTIYSPLVVSDASTARGIRRQPDTQATFAQFSSVTIAVGAVGSWRPEDSLMMSNAALSDHDRAEALRRGVVAEFSSTLVTDSGSVETFLDDRCISIAEQELRQIETVIAVAGGPTKTRAIRALLTSGLINGLVTDSASAERLLAT